MKKVIFFIAFIAFSFSVSAQIKPTRNIGRETKITMDANTDFTVVVDSGSKKVGRLVTAEEMKRYATTAVNGRIDSTIEAINDVSTYSEATYQKIATFKTSNNVFYVSRKWTGIRGGTSWQSQMDAAQVGNQMNTYPDPFAARDAAAKLLVAGTIQKATIVVYEGEVFTAAQESLGYTADYYHRFVNGGSKYHPYPSTTADANDDSVQVSLYFPNLIWDWKKGSGINYVGGYCALGIAYDTVAIQSIGGLGNFNWKHKNNGGNKNLISATSKGLVEFSCDSMTIKRWDESMFGWSSISIWGAETRFSANYMSSFDYNSVFRFCIGAKIKIGKIETDTTQLPYNNAGALGMYVGWFYPLLNDLPNSLLSKIEVDNAVLWGMPLMVMAGNGVKKATIDYVFKNITHNYRPTYIVAEASDANTKALITYPYGSNANNITDSRLKFTIENYRGQSSVLSWTGAGIHYNSNVTFDFKNCYVDSIKSSSVTQRSAIEIGSMQNDSSQFTINANVIHSCNSVLKAASNASYTVTGQLKTLSKVYAAVEVTGSNSNVKIAGNLSADGTQNSISGTGTVTVLPSAIANTAAAGTITTNGTLSVNAAYKQ